MLLWRATGLLLFAGLISWLIVEATVSIGRHPTPEVLGLGNAFEGNLQLPSEKITAAFSEARQRMLKVNANGNNLRLGGNIAGWLSFAATSLITLIVGFFGRPPAPAGSTSSTEGLPARSVRLIGFFAALAAVLTGAASLSIEKSQDYFKRSDEIRALLVQSRAQVIDAKSAEEAQAILDNLTVQSSR
jgi:hypothetical protein